MLILVSCQSQGPRRKGHNKIGDNRTSNRGHRIGSDKIRKGWDGSVRVSSVRLELVSGLIVWARTFAYSFVLDFIYYFVRVSVCDFVWVTSETLV
ncbi:hypothetical protein HZH68_001426 [Vespula germanica]|uniref:Uncharacterized protein n=1 Tax=Vespula germanica TaxID=30212 RepID=A0A834U6W0_VESGE|nr:hypothetical protein HZH68_001426 [Vespula germanica]